MVALTGTRVVELVLAEEQFVVGDGTRVELAAEDDVSRGGPRLLVVALDEDVSSQLETRVQGHTHPPLLASHVAGTSKDNGSTPSLISYCKYNNNNNKALFAIFNMQVHFLGYPGSVGWQHF